MGYELADLLQFIDDPKIGTVTKEDVERAYEKYLIEEAIELKYIVAIKKDDKIICKITDSDRTFLIAQKGLNVQVQDVEWQTKTDNRNFWLQVIGLILGAAIIVTILIAITRI